MHAQEQPHDRARQADRHPGASRTQTGPRPTSAAARLLALQRLAGNAAVARALAEERHDAAQDAVQRSLVHDVLRSPSRPLDPSVRTEMEARIGADFSDVRIHDDAAAQASAAELGARAYTSGNHVVIGRGGADPHTLAHELTHVVQQRQGPVAGTDNGSGLRVSDPSDRFEREAEANAHRVMSAPHPHDAHPGTAPTTPDAVQRRPASAAATGHPVVQRVITYDRAPWSRQHLAPDAFAQLLRKQSSDTDNAFSVPYGDLFQALNDSTVTIEINEEQPSVTGSRASFTPDSEGVGGILKITPPSTEASGQELRAFGATLTHEMQHALDSVQKRYSSQESPQSMKERKISSELRAFGREAAAALKLALGNTYQGKPSDAINAISEARISSERKRLALEFQTLYNFKYGKAGHHPITAFATNGSIRTNDSVILERLAGYVRQYITKDSEYTPSSQEALDWLAGEKDLPWLNDPASKPRRKEVLNKGLLEAIDLFKAHRPQKA